MSSNSRQRVWVRERDGTPTRVQYQSDDLVDDVKSSVLQRYANSLGRVLDAPSIGLRIIPRVDGPRAYRERLLEPGEDIAQVLQDCFPNGQTADEALVIEILARLSPGASVEDGEEMYGQRRQAYSTGAQAYVRPMPPSRHDSAWSMRSKKHSASVASTPGSMVGPAQVPDSPRPEQLLDVSKETARPALQNRLPTRGKGAPTIQERSSSAAGEARDSPSSRSIANASTMPPINVLLVDDNSVSLNVLAKRMRGLKLGYETATNGSIAVQKWQAGRFHIIFMDLRMPVMSGIAATKEIRRLEQEATQSRPPVIIVALTASSLPADRDEALTVGCNDFLTKPPDLPWLDRKVQEWGCMQALIDFDGWTRSKGCEPVEGE